jgi:pimeloyl-ACP methyl ester carboxylesterase
MTETSTEQKRVVSRDGTDIGVSITGYGRPLVVSPGALCAARDWQPLAETLVDDLMTYAIDRRGRASSGDNALHTIEREREDIAAVLKLAGPAAVLLGHSYGGLIALEQAVRNPPTALILYEPPIPLDGPIGGEALPEFERAVQEEDLDGALAFGLKKFLRLPESAINDFRRTPVWPVRASMVSTWAREVRAMDTFDADLTRFAGLHSPTLLIIGELSPPWLTETSRQLNLVLPNSRIVEIPREAHDAFLTDPEAMAALIRSFADAL